ncbi:MAG: histidine--tRNA ligase [Lachnospiraceae bacterium]|nr:histidine--tRNA ligase [Lachnospiraceae bacterium]
MSELVKPRTLSGFMELQPRDQVLFDRIRMTLEETYSSFGFFPLDTPILEHSDILLAKAGGETEKQIYRFEKGDTDLTMRFDLTVPLAKYVAMNANELAFPFKRYQIGKVYRGERAQKGRFREFYQADIDIIGDGKLDIRNDAEIPSIIYEGLKKLGIRDFQIRINNRKVLNGLFSVHGVADRSTDILRTVDKLEKIGKENVAESLAELGIPKASTDALLHVLCAGESTEEMLALLKEYQGKDETLDQGLAELSEVLREMENFGVDPAYFRTDLTIARGLDYYTGTVYETTIKKHPEIGSICSGGRYDNLAEFYTSRKLPGVGMSIGLTRLFYILQSQNYLNAECANAVDVLIIPMTKDLAEPLSTSTFLRSSGIRAQVYFEEKKFKQKIAYADKLGIPWCMFLGEDEIKEGKVSLKKLATGEQVTVTREEALSLLLAEKERRNALPAVLL